MQRERENKKPNCENNELLRFIDFVSTEDHFTSTHRRCFVKKGVLV